MTDRSTLSRGVYEEATEDEVSNLKMVQENHIGLGSSRSFRV